MNFTVIASKAARNMPYQLCIGFGLRIFTNLLCDGAVRRVNTRVKTAIHIGQLTIFQKNGYQPALIDRAAIAAYKVFFFHFILPQLCKIRWVTAAARWERQFVSGGKEELLLRELPKRYCCS